MDLIISKTSIPGSLVQQIRDMMVNKKLKSGDTLPSQRKMASELGVGVPSIREALKIMEGMGLVKIRHGSSTVIERINMESVMTNLTPLLELTGAEVLCLLEAKDFIETKCAYAAANRATSEELKELENYIREMEINLDNTQKYAQLDYLFHLAIVKAAHNPVINEIMKVAGRMILKGLEITSYLPGRDIAMDYHIRIFTAIHNRDGELAGTLIHEHILETEKRYKRTTNYHESTEADTRK